MKTMYEPKMFSESISVDIWTCIYLLYEFFDALHDMLVEFYGLDGSSCQGVHLGLGYWWLDIVQAG